MAGWWWLGGADVQVLHLISNIGEALPVKNRVKRLMVKTCFICQ